jgi:hypothetical protein
MAPINYHGRILSPYRTRYLEMETNDVRMTDRKSALEGKYRSQEVDEDDLFS